MDLRDLLELPKSDSDLPDTLYHYTDIYGLKGIYEDGQLWATNSLFLNDTSEFQLGISILRGKVLEGLSDLWREKAAITIQIAGEGASEPQTDTLTPAIEELEQIRDAIEMMHSYLQCYIACLTEEGDQLGQWRGYARGGYCIGFRTKLLLEGIDIDQTMRRVHYSNAGTDDQYALKAIESAKLVRARKALSFLREDYQKILIASRMLLDAAYMKDSHFKEEREIRIVQLEGIPDIFTPHKYGMVPRVTIPLADGAIRSVTVGPSPHSELKLRSLINYFLHVGFKKRDLDNETREVRETIGIPQVRTSVIPYRDW
jgi:hypothetical protein